MKGNIWNLVSRRHSRPSQPLSRPNSQIFSTSSTKKVRSERRKLRRPRQATLPLYTTTPNEHEVTLPSSADPKTVKLAIEIAKLQINDSSAPPPTYEPYDLSPRSVKSSFQL